MTKYRERMITRIAQAMKNNSILRYLVYAADTVSHTTTREKKREIKIDLTSSLILRNLFQLQNFT